jgi:ligand-binding sensor domain-containing protein
MNKSYLYYPLLVIIVLASSCNTQNRQSKSVSSEQTKAIETQTKITSYGEQDKVTSGLLDKSGDLWFGTSNEGVYRYDGKTFVNYTEENGLPTNDITSIEEDGVGNLWFGTKKGLCKYDGKSFTTVLIPWDGGEHQQEDYWWNPNVIQCLLTDENGDLWVGTAGYGAYHYDGKTFTNLSFTNDSKQVDSLHHNFIQSMVEDTNGNIWFTSLTHGGISRYDGTGITYFSVEDGLKDDMVFSSYQDKAGTLWFGSIQTKHEGLYRYDGSSFIGYGKEDGLCDNFVTGFFEDKAGMLWIRTGSILCLYNGKTFAPFLTKEGKGLKDINFIIEDKEQNIWMGGRYGNLWKYDGETLLDFTQKGA